MILKNVREKPFCVYGHYADGKLFHVGSGTIRWAFDIAPATRSDKWRVALGNRALSVQIFETFKTLAEARRAERLRKPQPPIRRGPIVVTHVETGLRWECATVDQARRLTRVTSGAISSAISKRHPVVRGFTFDRTT